MDQLPAAPGQGGRFGPNTAAVEALLERARQVTEAEADGIWAKHLEQRERENQFRAALEAVIYSGTNARRGPTLKIAEQAGRDAVRVYAGHSLGTAIAGYVGRLAEATVVADVVDPISLEPLTRPWIEVIGPLDLRPRR